jgi:hypothetical protein
MNTKEKRVKLVGEWIESNQEVVKGLLRENNSYYNNPLETYYNEACGYQFDRFDKKWIVPSFIDKNGNEIYKDVIKDLGFTMADVLYVCAELNEMGFLLSEYADYQMACYKAENTQFLGDLDEEEYINEYIENFDYMGDFNTTFYDIIFGEILYDFIECDIQFLRDSKIDLILA